MQDLILVQSGATFTLGILRTEESKTTSDGCSIITLEDTASYRQFIIRCASATTGTVYLYSSTIIDGSETATLTNHLIRTLSNTSRVWNCIICNVQISQGQADLYNVNMQATKSGRYGISSFSGTSDEVIISDIATACYIGVTNQTSTFTNFRIVSNTILAEIATTGTTSNFVNSEADNWNFTFTYAGTINRKYDYDLTVLNGEITDFVEDANVTLSKGGVQIGTWLTNSSGQIETQTLTYGFYNQTGGNTMYDGSYPFVLTVTHDDWADYTSRFYVTEKTKMTISMQDTTTANNAALIWSMLFGTLAFAVFFVWWVRR